MREGKRKNIPCLLNPGSIAIIGASTDYSKPNARPVKYLTQFGYTGKIYPVNPKYEQLHGFTCYKSVKEIGAPVDLAIIAVPASLVKQCVVDCLESKVKSVVIFSAGFSETGEEGAQLQGYIGNIVREENMVVLGPNCIGVVNSEKAVTATFSAALERNIKEGTVSFITQSGAFGSIIYGMASELELGFRYFVSTGNEMDLSLLDFLEYLIDENETKAIAGYMEGIRDGNRFVELAEKALMKKKALIFLKTGKSSSGGKAALSHTGALTGSSKVYEALFRQKGIIGVKTVEELLEYSMLASHQKYPASPNIAIITTSGGAGVLMADICEEFGLELPELSNKVKSKLEKLLPKYASAANPVDITAQVVGNIDYFTQSMKVLLEEEKIDGLVIFLGLLDSIGEKLAEAIAEVSQITNKLITVVWMAAPKKVVKILRDNSIPLFRDPNRCIGALGELYRFNRKLQQLSLCKKIEPVKLPSPVNIDMPNYGGMITLEKIKELLGLYGLEIAESRLADSAEAAVAIAEDLGYPVVLKIESPEIQHKTEAGGVILNLTDNRQVEKAYTKIIKNAGTQFPDATVLGVNVQKMINDIDLELIMGMNHDPVFGPVVLFGLGGIYVEIFADTVLGIPPLNREEIKEMITGLRGYPVLCGARGGVRVDLEKLIDVIQSFSEMVYDNRDIIQEIDLNPLVVCDNGSKIKAIDALIKIREES